MTRLEDRFQRELHEAVHDVRTPVGFAEEALSSGRRRRARRAAAVVSAGTAAVVAGVLLLPALGSETADRDDARDDGRRAAAATAVDSRRMAWARGLPAGHAPRLPFYDGAALRDGDVEVTVPDAVDQGQPPLRVEGGWVVRRRAPLGVVAPAVLSPGGALRALPVHHDSGGGGSSLVVVSRDGRQVAYGASVVDVATGEATALPHDPVVEEPANDGYAVGIRLAGWAEDGLVYDGAPTREGLGTQWLLRPDGSTVRLSGPEWEGVPRSEVGAAAGHAVLHDYSDARTCTGAYAVRAQRWEATGTGCMGRYLEEALSVSPGGRWLLTDDLPEVWDLARGRWVRLDAPEAAFSDPGHAWLGAVGWESDDVFLAPVPDRVLPLAMGGEPVEQAVQVVRCDVSAGSCERAGEELALEVRHDREVASTSPRVTFATY